jgi:hypothetical protein
MPAPRENVIQAEVRLALGRERDLVLYRNSVGVAKEWDARTHTERVIRYGLANGSADLVGVLTVRVAFNGAERALGRFFALEVKRPGEQPTAEQKQWATLMRARGAFVATVCSADDARAALARARAGASE